MRACVYVRWCVCVCGVVCVVWCVEHCHVDGRPEAQGVRELGNDGDMWA